MAVIANTYRTGDAKGLREDLSDLIENISPEDTPYYSSAGRDTAKAVFKEWQTDELAAPNTSNAVPEGDDITSFTAVAPTQRIGVHTQISRKELIISGTLEAVDKAGRRSELAYQLAKKSQELKRDIEAMLLANIADSGTDPRRTPGLPAYVKTNVDMGTGGANPSWTTVPNDVRTDGTQRAFTESMLKSVIKLCFDQGSKPDTLMVGSFNKQVASTFTGVATKTYNINSETPAATIAAVDVYVSDFGPLKIIPNRFQRPRDAWVLDFDFIKVAFLRPFQTVSLAKTGDAEKRMLLVEYAHVVTQEKALGLIADLTTS